MFNDDRGQERNVSRRACRRLTQGDHCNSGVAGSCHRALFHVKHALCAAGGGTALTPKAAGAYNRDPGSILPGSSCDAWIARP
jgi:hypothetical protein